MSKYTKTQVLAEAAKQGLTIAAYSSTLIAKFVLCVLKGSLTKPLPIAVANCISKLK